jgi:hypothetical protein
MSNDETRGRVDEVKNFVILSNTHINYLLQLFDLVRDKNRILMVHEPFFAMVIRDMNRGLLLDLRALVENREDTHNIQTLVRELSAWTAENRDQETAKQLSKITDSLLVLAQDQLAKKILIIASTQAAHRSLKLPTKKESFTYAQAREWLSAVGETLNQISGLLWSAGTVMEVSGSEADGFKNEMKHMERAELAGTHLLRIEESHEAVNYANRLLNRTKGDDA